MARFNKIQVLNTIAATGMVPVFYHKDPTVTRNVLKACYEGGVALLSSTIGEILHKMSLLIWFGLLPKNVRI
jgi:2-dehydro-3-deoxyphosphogluconate aldolase/(4S)-4-hydroxy-2-oxoglutarate aldolase